MLKRVERWIMLLFVIAVASLGVAALVTGFDQARERQALKSNDLTGLRSEALDLFPRGSRLDAATVHLTRIGFLCEPIAHPLPDISGPSLHCASHGRGYPDFPAVNVILLTRNGMISDVDVWNVIAKADDEPDEIDFTDVGASRLLPGQLRRPAAPDAADPEVDAGAATDQAESSSCLPSPAPASLECRTGQGRHPG